MAFSGIMKMISNKRQDNFSNEVDREAQKIKQQERYNEKQARIQNRADQLREHRLKLQKEVGALREIRGEKVKIQQLQREKYKPIFDIMKKTGTGIKSAIARAKKVKGNKRIKIQTGYYGGAVNSPFGNEMVNSPFAPRK